MTDEGEGTVPATHAKVAAESEVPPRLAFSVLGAEPDPASATPSIALALEVRAPPGVSVCSVTLAVQVRIAPRRRALDGTATERPVEEFGPVEPWPSSLHSLLWTRTVVAVPPFVEKTRVTVPLPCSYDLEVAANQVLHGLSDGAVPLELHFSGTLFFARADGHLRAALLPWDDGLAFDLAGRAWWEAIDRFFPSSAWLRIDRRTFDRLHAHRRRGRLRTWDATIADLLERGGELGRA